MVVGQSSDLPFVNLCQGAILSEKQCGVLSSVLCTPAFREAKHTTRKAL